MSDGLSLQLQGDRDIVAAFNELKQFISKNALRRSVREGAKLLLDAIQKRAPVGTGRLLKNIVIRVRVTRKTLRARVTVNTRGKEDDPQNAFYFRFLEKGFTTRGGQKRMF